MTVFIGVAMAYFTLSLVLSLLNLLFNLHSKESSGAPIGAAIEIIIALTFLTWGIILLTS